jgi:hypothetical protein
MKYTIDQLKSESESILNYLEITCSNDPEEIKERISNLVVYMSRSGEMLSQAKRILRAKKTSEIQNTIIAIAKAAHLSANVQNALLDSICEEESYLVDRIDRVNRSCTHQVDALRSLLSYEKEDMRITKTGY